MINEYTCSDTMEIQTANLKQDLGSGNTVIWSLQFRVWKQLSGQHKMYMRITPSFSCLCKRYVNIVGSTYQTQDKEFVVLMLRCMWFVAYIHDTVCHGEGLGLLQGISASMAAQGLVGSSRPRLCCESTWWLFASIYRAIKGLPGRNPLRYVVYYCTH